MAIGILMAISGGDDVDDGLIWVRRGDAYSRRPVAPRLRVETFTVLVAAQLLVAVLVVAGAGALLQNSAGAPLSSVLLRGAASCTSLESAATS